MFVRCWHMSLSDHVMSLCSWGHIFLQITFRFSSVVSIFDWLIKCKSTYGPIIIEKLSLTCSLGAPFTDVDRVEVSSLLSVLPGTVVYRCCTLSVQADCTPVQWTWNVTYSLHLEQRMSHGNRDPRKHAKKKCPHSGHSWTRWALMMSFVLSGMHMDHWHGSHGDEDIIGACQKMVRVSQPRIVPGVSTCHHCNLSSQQSAQHPLLARLFAILISYGMWPPHQECPAATNAAI